jgi:hypothetical protein
MKERTHTLETAKISQCRLREIEQSLPRPTPEELLKRLQSQGRVELTSSVAEAVRAEREGR